MLQFLDFDPLYDLKYNNLMQLYNQCAASHALSHCGLDLSLTPALHFSSVSPSPSASRQTRLPGCGPIGELLTATSPSLGISSSELESTQSLRRGENDSSLLHSRLGRTQMLPSNIGCPSRQPV